MFYYTYIIIDPRDRQPLYVGKGTDRRMYMHWRERNTTRGNQLLKRKLKELELCGKVPIYEKVLVNVDEKSALKKECELITSYGRLDLGTGPLCNFTDGGATTWSPQTKERKRQYELSKKKGRPVSQYTLQGEHIADYSSAKVASESVPGANRSYITQVCKGKRKSAGGFMWTYKGDSVSTFTKKYYRPVKQYSLDGQLLQTFPSLTHAQTTTGIELHNISEACRGNSKTAGGFIWKYKN